MYSPIFMYGEVKNVKKIFYFARKVGAFEVSKIVFISVVEQSFHTRNCFDWFGSCGSPNRAYDGLLESPICLVFCPKLSDN